MNKQRPVFKTLVERAKREAERRTVPAMATIELGRPVEPPEIAHFADPGCRACWGSGLFIARDPNTDAPVRHACGCARDRFVEASRDAIGYDPGEDGVPVRWRKGHDPREREAQG